MNFELEERPKEPLVRDGELWVRWDTWFYRLYEFIKDLYRSGNSGDLDATLGPGQTYHGVTALTAPRAVTLPSSKRYKDGQSVVIQDESGDAGTHTITVNAASGDSISGVSTISSNFGRVTLFKRGVIWFGG